ncbi:MAG: hypothetical protein ACU837_08705 [Gammaproteobacteria bacterium]
MYQYFSLTNIVASERVNLLGLKIRQWSPYKNTGLYIVNDAAGAQVWIWDEEKRLEKLPAEKYAALTVLPETLLQQKPLDDELRLIECLEGYEAQAWQHNSLRFSRWWPHLPNNTQWADFCRAAGVPADQTVPEVQSPAALDKPWARSSRKAFRFAIEKERQIIFGTGLAIIFAATWQLAAIIRWQAVNNATEEQVQKYETRISDIIQTRDAAIQDQFWINNLTAVVNVPGQLSLMQEISAQLPQKPEAQITSWNYQSNLLEFVISGDNLDPATIVRQYQKLPWAGEIVVEPAKKVKGLHVVIPIKG